MLLYKMTSLIFALAAYSNALIPPYGIIIGNQDYFSFAVLDNGFVAMSEGLGTVTGSVYNRKKF
jgi:hypothetical protein